MYLLINSCFSFFFYFLFVFSYYKFYCFFVFLFVMLLRHFLLLIPFLINPFLTVKWLFLCYYNWILLNSLKNKFIDRLRTAHILFVVLWKVWCKHTYCVKLLWRNSRWTEIKLNISHELHGFLPALCVMTLK